MAIVATSQEKLFVNPNARDAKFCVSPSPMLINTQIKIPLKCLPLCGKSYFCPITLSL